MSTSSNDISQWFDHGCNTKATHLIVVCDTYDWDDYPVYVKSSENVREVFEHYSDKNMQRVMEVYNLKEDKETQLQQTRSFNF
jgi:hypothetical protein